MEALNELEAFAYHPGASSSTADEAPRKRPRVAPRDASDLLAQAEREFASSKVEVAETLDANSLKRMILSVEKRINENLQLRVKYAEQPERFLDSELELFQELKALHSVAATPELFPTFVRTRCTASLLGLLAHDNLDISSDVVDLFYEMTDADDATPEDLQSLVDALLENDAPMALIAHMEKLNDANEEEARCIHSTLGIFENILEARPASAAAVAKSGLMAWTLGRLKARGFHANKLYAAEILALLLQQHSENQQLLGELEGILSLLVAASQFKRREPADLEEAELMENTLGCLTTSLALPENQHRFLKAEGIELMILTLKERKYASRGALRVLDAALRANGANCERFVDIRGFKTVLPLIGAAPPPQPAFAKGRKEREAAQRQFDESVVGIVSTLFHQLVGERRLRLLGKLAEDGMAKLDMLLRLRHKYAARVAAAEEEMEGAASDEDGEEDELGYDERLYLARVEAGLPCLQAIDHCLAFTCAAKAKGCKPMRQRVLLSLYEAGASLHDVWATVEESARLDVEEKSEAVQRALDEMGEAVKALLSKYKDAAADEEEERQPEAEEEPGEPEEDEAA
ncbi:hypothetical protein AB1Y20_021599 [Prymnesium parvum]|uniref:Beta-catenin-like protein 1 N-terminal domain-containing protein n=1 Tax=Prymnesium parvum TaxID=97485 RepID=A0AB34JLP4_PRYPA